MFIIRKHVVYPEQAMTRKPEVTTGPAHRRKVDHAALDEELKATYKTDTVEKIAARCGCGKATVNRRIKALGLARVRLKRPRIWD